MPYLLFRLRFLAALTADQVYVRLGPSVQPFQLSDSWPYHPEADPAESTARFDVQVFAPGDLLQHDPA
jgi:hypothetical protein